MALPECEGKRVRICGIFAEQKGEKWTHNSKIRNKSRNIIWRLCHVNGLIASIEEIDRQSDLWQNPVNNNIEVETSDLRMCPFFWWGDGLEIYKSVMAFNV